MREHPRLARAGARDDEERAVGRDDRLALDRVQPGEEIVARRSSRPPVPFGRPAYRCSGCVNSSDARRRRHRGTFTDLVADDGRIVKVPSTPADPAAGGRGGDRRRSPPAARGARPRHDGRAPTRCSSGAAHRSRWSPPRLRRPHRDRPAGPARRSTTRASIGPTPLVDRARAATRCGGRLDADGARARAARPADDPGRSPDGVEAVAVCLLHADLNPAHEQAVAGALRGRGLRRDRARTRCRPSSASTSAPSRPWSTPTCGPSAATYLARHSRRLADEVLVMTSAGGLVPVADAAELPGGAAAHRARPAACWPAAAVAARGGFPDAVTFDMGGTSTDVCLVLDGGPSRRRARWSAGYPVRLPVARRAHHRRRRWLDRPARRRRRAGGRPRERRRRARARPATAAAARADRHRRRPRAGRIPADVALPGTRRARPSTRRARRARPRRRHRRGRDRGGRRRDGAGAARGVGRARRRPARPRAGRVRWRRSAARVRAGRRARHARGDRPAARRRAVGGRHPRCRRQVDASWCESWPDPPDHDGARRRARRARQPRPRRTRRALERVRRSTSCARLPLRRPEPRAHRAVASRPSTAEHERRNGYARPDTRSRSSRCGRAPAARRRCAIDDLPPVDARRGASARPSIAEADCTIWVPTGWRADAGPLGALDRCERCGAREPRPGRRCRSSSPGSPASPRRWARCCGGPRSAPTSRSGPTARRRVFTAAGELLAQAEHIPVHLGSMPASVAAAIDASTARGVAPGDQIDPQRPVRGRDPPQRHHRGRPVLTSAGRLVGWAANRAHHADVGGIRARLAAGRRRRDRAGGPAHPAGAARRRGAGADRRVQLAHARRAAGDLDAQVGANVVGAAAVELATRSAAEPFARGRSTTASGGCAPRCARSPDGAWRFADVLDRTGPRPSSSSRRRSRSP